MLTPGCCGSSARTVTAAGFHTRKCFRRIRNPVYESVPLVPAITVTAPAIITVTYLSGTVTDASGINTGPNGVFWYVGSGAQTPLQEAQGVALGSVNNLDALMGVFVPATRVNSRGFQTVDGTKPIAAVGIMPNGLFFIGVGLNFEIKQAGTLFLGINDYWVSDNGGGFTVLVTVSPMPNR
jgi:hypothetical protein